MIPNQQGLIWVVITCLTFYLMPTYAETKPSNFISPFLIYYGQGEHFKTTDFETLAKFDVLVVDRFRYKKEMNTWNEIRKRNPFIYILLYQLGPEVSSQHDHYNAYYLNNIGRYNNARSHPHGDINNDNKHYFLLNSSGTRITIDGYPNNFLLDFGNDDFTQYWLKSTYDDVLSHDWVADGIMIDNALTFHQPSNSSQDLFVPAKYSDDGQWDEAMNRYITTATNTLHQFNQMVIVNRGNSRHEKSLKAWAALDAAETVPDIVMEEGAFAVSWGTGDVQFYSVDQWCRQVELASNINTSTVALLSHTDLMHGESGLDSFGRPVSFEQVFYYSLASYLLAKRDDAPHTLFSFDYGRKNGTYKTLSWFEVYDALDLGSALGTYQKLSGVGDIYFREFESGYVYVNPGTTLHEQLPVPEGAVYLLPTLSWPWASLNLTHFDLKPSSAAYLKKVVSP